MTRACARKIDHNAVCLARHLKLKVDYSLVALQIDKVYLLSAHSFYLSVQGKYDCLHNGRLSAARVSENSEYTFGR